jgi:hypothetical protein
MQQQFEFTSSNIRFQLLRKKEAIPFLLPQSFSIFHFKLKGKSWDINNIKKDE